MAGKHQIYWGENVPPEVMFSDQWVHSYIRSVNQLNNWSYKKKNINRV